MLLDSEPPPFELLPVVSETRYPLAELPTPLTAEPDYVIYEYACHDGNYAIPNILAGARKAESEAEGR